MRFSSARCMQESFLFAIVTKVQRVRRVCRAPVDCHCKVDRHFDAPHNSDKLCSTIQRAAARFCCDDEWSATKDHAAVFPATINRCQSTASSTALLATIFTIFRRDTVPRMNLPLHQRSNGLPDARQIRAKSCSPRPGGGTRAYQRSSNRRYSARVSRESPMAWRRDGTIAIRPCATSTICSPIDEVTGGAFPRMCSKSCTGSRLFTKRSIQRPMMFGVARLRYHSSRAK